MVSELKGAFSKSTAVLLSVLLFVFGIISIPVPAKAAVGDVTGGSFDWGISSYLNAGNFGRPSPLVSGYGAPATYDSTTKVTSWGNGSATVAISGDSTLAFEGTSLNFSGTGGGWLKLKDPQLTLDTDGNGVMSALVSYGLAPGAYPDITYDPDQAPVRGPERVNVLDFSGNSDAFSATAANYVWTNLSSVWHDDLLEFLAGDAGNDIDEYAYASTITNTGDANRLPSSVNISLEREILTFTPTSYNMGDFNWGISTYLNAGNFGRPSPLVSAYGDPATYDSTTKITTWTNGSGSVTVAGNSNQSFEGTSVNFSGTGGGWLKLKDPQLTLDTDGNGVMSALVSYGLAPGAYPDITYDPDQAPVRGPERVNVLDFAGNEIAPIQSATAIEWNGLASIWHDDFLDFLAGTDGIASYIYASTITNTGAADRLPSPVSISLGIIPATTTTTTLSVAPSTTVAAGTKVTLTATVSPTASGSVVFKQGTSTVATVAVSAGSANYSTTLSTVGSTAYTAEFQSADTDAYTSSTSSSVAITVTEKVSAQAGVLSWGFKSSFRSYILGGGSISTSGGAGGSTSLFKFPQGGDSFNHATGLGSANFSGTVTFAYAGHGINIRLSNPRIVIGSSSSATLYVNLTANGVTSNNVAFANLVLTSGTKSTNETDVTTYSNVPANLTAAGSTAFAGFYGPGESLDPLSFTIGVEGSSFNSVSATGTEKEWVAPTTPPATTGLDLDGFEPGSQLEPGSALTVGASGFVPNETGIKVVIYSTPTVLATDVTADATGKAVWEGNLPADLVGEHTLTFQGSKSYGIVVNIAETVVSPVQQLDPSSFQCVISGAELKWGFKESWRSYLTTIAKGGWETSDGANYETPEFILTSTNGSIDSATGAAIIAFDGSINFYGHEGALNTTITNFFIEITAEGNAYFVADVIGELREGGQIKQEQVRIAKLNHPKLGEDGQAVIYEPVFTAEGGEAFSYAEGDALDPMTITVNYTDCGIDNGGTPAATDGDSGLLWLWILLGTIAIVAVITIAIVARKNAKK